LPALVGLAVVADAQDDSYHAKLLTAKTSRLKP